MEDQIQLLECPMCAFAVLPVDEYVIRLHFEQVHVTNSSFVVEDGLLFSPSSTSLDPLKDALSPKEDANLVECSEPDCGEIVLLTDFNDHLDYHATETLSFDETIGTYHSHSSAADMQDLSTAHNSDLELPKQASREPQLATNVVGTARKNNSHSHKLKKHTSRRRSNASNSEKSTLSRSILTFNPFAKLEKTVKPPSSAGRLGKSELGPYAWEDRMPRWLHDQLEAGPKITTVNRISRDGHLLTQEHIQNETPGLLLVLAQLSALDRSVKEAYYCHPSTLHIGKTPKEGSFCGYRNIQMLLSYIQGAKAQGHEEFLGRTPGILKLQDFIEKAWDKGINAIGRVQTGGVRDTRKYIGTPEAQAFFLSSEISCAVEMFSDNKSRGMEAHESLLGAIERYFSQATVHDGSHVYKTLLPPVYLQQPGHSLTIVGFERHRDNSCNLLVFDPMYHTSPAMHKLLGRRNIGSPRPEVMHAYRRGIRQLRKHAAFEILMLTATPPLFPAWDVARQFPDCRFVYAFFRSRTLGYDVYPEDHFLRNFPWHQFGGLWICDEARFARAEPIRGSVAQALRRMTSNGGSNQTSQHSSPTSPFTTSPLLYLPAADAHMRNKETCTELPSYTTSFGECKKSSSTDLQQNCVNGSMFNKIGKVVPSFQPHAATPKLSLLTDVGRKYPGFPTPLSPTCTAMRTFSSPAFDVNTGHALHGAISSTVRMASSKDVGNNEQHESLIHDITCSQEHCIRSMSATGSNFVGNDAQSSEFWQLPIYSTSHVPSTRSSSVTAPLSPKSPASFHSSPRAAMLKNLETKQALQNLSHIPSLGQPPAIQFYPSAVNIGAILPHSPAQYNFPDSPCETLALQQLSIHIANGTETDTASPIDPSGTMLLYTSSRNVDSGLLGVRPLSEAQVAEYQFWRPCRRRLCAFGCGDAHEGERAAAKRLFKNAEEVKAEIDDDACKEHGREANFYSVADDRNENESAANFNPSVWAGRRLVTNWNQFLTGCEREGVANF